MRERAASILNVYIDESGEAGIAKVRTDSNPGASPYFVLGSTVCRVSDEPKVIEIFQKFRETIGKKSWKHATELGHPEKVLLARTLGKVPARFFGVISNKSTLGGYAEKIQKDPQKFYNKCATYLLEIILAYSIRRGFSAGDVRVIFEERNHDYDRMIRFVSAIKDNPLYEPSKVLQDFNPFAMNRMAKGESEMLDVADFVTHALFQTAHKIPANYNIPEPRYVREMQGRFGCSQAGVVLGAGIKCIHSLEQLNLDSDVQHILKNLRAEKPKIDREAE